MRIKKVKLRVSGKTLFKSVEFQHKKKFRDKAILNRTASEIKAQQIIEKYFILHKEFNFEFWFQFRRFDFFIPLIRTVIEIDGGYHQERNQAEYDKSCDKYLRQKHRIKVIRVRNEYVESSLESICYELKKEFLLKQSNKALEVKHKKKSTRNKIKTFIRKLKFHKPVLKKEPKIFQPKVILRKATVNLVE